MWHDAPLTTSEGGLNDHIMICLQEALHLIHTYNSALSSCDQITKTNVKTKCEDTLY